MNYRIMIEEKNDGSKEYTPQCCQGFWNYYFNRWDNIVRNSLKDFHITNTMREIYFSEMDAKNIIEEYKIYLDKKIGKNVKKTTYKYIN